MRVRERYPDGSFGVWKDVPGIPGKSAYQYAKEGGYTGTEEEFKTKMAAESAPFFVEVTMNEDGSYVANKTFEEIKRAYESGVSLYANYLADGGTYRCPLLVCIFEEDDAEVYFSLVDGDGSTIIILITPDTVEVQEDSISPELPEMHPLTLKLGNNTVIYNGTVDKSLAVSSLPSPYALTIGGQSYDGSEEAKVDLPTAFYINLTSDGSGNYTKDKAMEEIQSAYEAGRPLYCNLTIEETPTIAVLASAGTSLGDVPCMTFSAVSYIDITNTSPICIAIIFIIGEEVFIQYSNIPKYEDIPSIDSTLLIKGNAADAKAVGDILALKANKTDIIQSDWKQTNETAVDFIKNKPDFNALRTEIAQKSQVQIITWEADD
jgi:hypothetical protein